jgi:Cof subfamily protein (haloacid dehalogenase superfamily)
MHYKAIISDFDGTLVGKDLIIPDSVKGAIRSLKNAQITFLIASGRSYYSFIAEACKDLGLTSPQITNGGAEIIDPKTDKVLSAEYIEEKIASQVIETLQKEQVAFWVEKRDGIYTVDGKERGVFGPIPFKKVAELSLTEIPKIGIFPFDDEIKEKRIETVLKDAFVNLHITKSYSPSGKSWDLTAAMANKQEAVLKVSRILGIDPKEIIGIGDGYNDFPLLEACGYKVAVENAHDELKAIADEIIPSYGQGGVGIFINNLLKNKKD